MGESFRSEPSDHFVGNCLDNCSLVSLVSTMGHGMASKIERRWVRDSSETLTVRHFFFFFLSVNQSIYICPSLVWLIFTLANENFPMVKWSL